MVEIKIERNAEKQNDVVVVNSKVTETMTKDEFKKNYSGMVSFNQQLSEQIETLKAELREYQDIKETQEDIKLAESLKKASKIVKRDELIEEIKKLEKKFIEKKTELEPLNRLAKEL